MKEATSRIMLKQGSPGLRVTQECRNFASNSIVLYICVISFMNKNKQTQIYKRFV